MFNLSRVLEDQKKKKNVSTATVHAAHLNPVLD